MRNGADIYAAASGHYIYPPLLAFLLQPLTFFSEPVAASIWAALTVAMMSTALLLAARELATAWQLPNESFDGSIPWKIAALSAVLMSDKVHEIFTLGQTDGLMLLGCALVLRWMQLAPVSAGIAVGAAANVKYLSGIFIPYFIIKRNYRAAISATVSFFVFLALPMIQTGVSRGLDYALVALGGVGRILHRPSEDIEILDVTWRRSASLTSTMFRATRAHGVPDSVALLLLFILAGAIIAAFLLISRRCGVSLFAHGQMGARVVSLEWAILIVLAVIFSPQTTPRHMVLLALVYCLALALIFLRGNAPRAALWSALLLMTFALSWPGHGTWLDPLLLDWRPRGGPSWCALILALVVTWAGSGVVPNESNQLRRANSSKM